MYKQDNISTLHKDNFSNKSLRLVLEYIINTRIDKHLNLTGLEKYCQSFYLLVQIMINRISVQNQVKCLKVDVALCDII